MIRGVLLDLDGVIYQSGELISGASHAVHWLAENDIPYAFVTNTSSKPQKDIIAKLHKLGIFANEQQVITPAIVASRWLAENTPLPPALLVPTAAKVDFIADSQNQKLGTTTGFGSVVVGDLGEQWDFAALNQAFRILMANGRTPLIALGMTRYWQAPEGLMLDVAPFVQALEHATGRQALVFGKPSQEFFQGAAKSIGSTPSQTIMVGDDIKGDVGGALSAGLMGVQVRTGKFRDQDLDQGITPTHVLDSIADLPDWLSSFN